MSPSSPTDSSKVTCGSDDHDGDNKTWIQCQHCSSALHRLPDFVKHFQKVHPHIDLDLPDKCMESFGVLEQAKANGRHGTIVQLKDLKVKLEFIDIDGGRQIQTTSHGPKPELKEPEPDPSLECLETFETLDSSGNDSMLVIDEDAHKYRDFGVEEESGQEEVEDAAALKTSITKPSSTLVQEDRDGDSDGLVVGSFSPTTITPLSESELDYDGYGYGDLIIEEVSSPKSKSVRSPSICSVSTSASPCWPPLLLLSCDEEMNQEDNEEYEEYDEVTTADPTSTRADIEQQMDQLYSEFLAESQAQAKSEEIQEIQVVQVQVEESKTEMITKSMEEPPPIKKPQPQPTQSYPKASQMTHSEVKKLLLAAPPRPAAPAPDNSVENMTLEMLLDDKTFGKFRLRDSATRKKKMRALARQIPNPIKPTPTPPVKEPPKVHVQQQQAKVKAPELRSLLKVNNVNVPSSSKSSTPNPKSKVLNPHPHFPHPHETWQMPKEPLPGGSSSMSSMFSMPNSAFALESQEQLTQIWNSNLANVHARTTINAEGQRVQIVPMLFLATVPVNNNGHGHNSGPPHPRPPMPMNMTMAGLEQIGHFSDYDFGRGATATTPTTMPTSMPVTPPQTPTPTSAFLPQKRRLAHNCTNCPQAFESIQTKMEHMLQCLGLKEGQSQGQQRQQGDGYRFNAKKLGEYTPPPSASVSSRGPLPLRQRGTSKPKKSKSKQSRNTGGGGGRLGTLISATSLIEDVQRKRDEKELSCPSSIFNGGGGVAAGGIMPKRQGRHVMKNLFEHFSTPESAKRRQIETPPMEKQVYARPTITRLSSPSSSLSNISKQQIFGSGNRLHISGSKLGSPSPKRSPTSLLKSSYPANGGNGDGVRGSFMNLNDLLDAPMKNPPPPPNQPEEAASGSTNTNGRRKSSYLDQLRFGNRNLAPSARKEPQSLLRRGLGLITTPPPALIMSPSPLPPDACDDSDSVILGNLLDDDDDEEEEERPMHLLVKPEPRFQKEQQFGLQYDY